MAEVLDSRADFVGSVLRARDSDKRFGDVDALWNISLTRHRWRSWQDQTRIARRAKVNEGTDFANRFLHAVLACFKKKACRDGEAMDAAQRDGTHSADAKVVAVDARERMGQLRSCDGQD
ncbi:hypothetical protein [Rhizobium sp. R339]|uniref:hypothetical protein n=1 Tax=Rhizobium sp. R339 TaxID=1764273 RepID=UPI00167C4677|nr:hypothetical protein [Rhizobium sp. R339]